MRQTQEVKVGDHIKTLIAVNEEGEFHFEKGDLFTVFELFHDSLPGCIRITDFEDQAENVWLESHEYEVAEMSQERTEQRDFAKDREIIGAATPGPWRRQKCLVAGRGAFAGQVIADCGGGFKPIDESNAIYITESRTAWPASLDEIDRLNAVIEGHALNVLAWETKVNDRDKETERLNTKCANLEAHNERLHELANSLSKEHEYAKRKAIEYNALSVKQAEEIDGLNAEAAGMKVTIQDQFDGRTKDWDEIKRLNATIEGLQEAVKEQTAKVQERDARIKELESDNHTAWAQVDSLEDEKGRVISQNIHRGTVISERDKEIERLEAKEARLINEARGASEDALKEAEENAELREEIERLRDEIYFARIEFNGIALHANVIGADNINRRATKASDRMFSALKGAE